MPGWSSDGAFGGGGRGTGVLPQTPAPTPLPTRRPAPPPPGGPLSKKGYPIPGLPRSPGSETFPYPTAAPPATGGPGLGYPSKPQPPAGGPMPAPGTTRPSPQAGGPVMAPPPLQRPIRPGISDMPMPGGGPMPGIWTGAGRPGRPQRFPHSTPPGFNGANPYPGSIYPRPGVDYNPAGAPEPTWGDILSIWLGNKRAGRDYQ